MVKVIDQKKEVSIFNVPESRRKETVDDKVLKAADGIITSLSQGGVLAHTQMPRRVRSPPAKMALCVVTTPTTQETIGPREIVHQVFVDINKFENFYVDKFKKAYHVNLAMASFIGKQYILYYDTEFPEPITFIDDKDKNGSLIIQTKYFTSSKFWDLVKGEAVRQIWLNMKKKVEMNWAERIMFIVLGGFAGAMVAMAVILFVLKYQPPPVPVTTTKVISGVTTIISKILSL